MNNDMKRLLTALVLIMLAVHGLWAQERVIILTDVENEPDDNESLVRLMLYTNEIDVRGIVGWYDHSENGEIYCVRVYTPDGLTIHDDE